MAGFDFDELEALDGVERPSPAAISKTIEVAKEERVAQEAPAEFRNNGLHHAKGKDDKEAAAAVVSVQVPTRSPSPPQVPIETEEEEGELMPTWLKKLVREFEANFRKEGKDPWVVMYQALIEWPDDGEGLWSDRQAAWWAYRMRMAMQAGIGHGIGNHVAELSLEPSMFRLHDPEHPIRYGGLFGKQRTPVVFLVAPPVEGLASYLRLDPNGPFAGGPLDWIYARDSPWWQKWKFAEDQEHVTKADWHAVPSSSEEAERFVPRLGKSVAMPRAPPRIEAFAESFRALNRVVWSAIHDSIIQLVQMRSAENPVFAKGEGRLLTELGNSLLIHGHFGVVEAQLRWGEGELSLPSHVDGITSLLHLGVTLGGRRTLRSATFPANNTASRVERNVWNEGMWNKDHLSNVLMTKGSIYLSSPYCFEHAVKYHSSGMNDPVIALQFRFALDGELGLKINTMRDDTMRQITTIIAGVLKTAAETGTLRLPSIQDVQNSEQRLRDAARMRQGKCRNRGQPKSRAEAKAKVAAQPKPKAAPMVPNVGSGPWATTQSLMEKMAADFSAHQQLIDMHNNSE